MRRGALPAMLALLIASRAGAQAFPSRSGELGIIDVPDAEIAGRGRNYLAAELRFDRVAGQPSDFGPLPVYGLTGLTRAVDVGFSMREWGQPGDPRPARTVLGVAAKLQLWKPHPGLPGLAVSTTFDRLNDAPVFGGRVAMSTSGLPVRLAGFLGLEVGTGTAGKTGAAVGLAGALPLTDRLDLEAEGLVSPQGQNYGAALNWTVTRNTGISLRANYLPGEDGLRVALTFAFWPTRALRERVAAASTPEAPQPEVERAEALAFKDPRPHFRLRIPVAGSRPIGAPAHRQHGPLTLRVAAAAPARPEPGTRPVAPSLEDLAEARLREQESLVDARERRSRSTAEQLDARERVALEEQKRLAERERELGEREQQLDARERTIATRQPPTQQQRQLESLEAQLAAQERSLAAQERSYGPALDAAEGRARDAAAREDAERQEANRLAASVGGAASRALQLDIRKQANAARNRQLAALEARLVAKGELIDSLERQLRTKAERLDAGSRRLDTRAERLDLLQRIGSEPKPSPEAPKPESTGAAAAKEEAAFVMVVKSPAAIVKERAAAPGPAAGAAPPVGGAVEKAVAAATVLMFPTPASQLSELDAEALANIAKLAARDRCELLIWARAQDPGTMAEAQRRATEIQAKVLAAAPLDPSQVVTRVAVRPGAKGVDVVVSALRATAKPTAAPAPRPETPKLLSGESGTRQLREAVQAAKGSIEACIGKVLEAKRLARAEGTLKLTVGTDGRVLRVTTGAGDISGTEVEDCLGAASRLWLFPAADAEYAVDVPIVVLRGGAR